MGSNFAEFDPANIPASPPQRFLQYWRLWKKVNQRDCGTEFGNRAEAKGLSKSTFEASGFHSPVTKPPRVEILTFVHLCGLFSSDLGEGAPQEPFLAESNSARFDPAKDSAKSGERIICLRIRVATPNWEVWDRRLCSTLHYHILGTSRLWSDSSGRATAFFDAAGSCKKSKKSMFRYQ